MYAVIQTGGKQIKVKVGQEIFVEKLDAEVDETITFNEVLLVGGEKTIVGKPLIDGANVKAKVQKQGKAKKIIVFRYTAKKGNARKQGHRQPYTKLLIEEINA